MNLDEAIRRLAGDDDALPLARLLEAWGWENGWYRRNAPKTYQQRKKVFEAELDRLGR